MSESRLHTSLKEVVEEALRNDGFSTYVEPEWPPVNLVSWWGYRPDVFGVRRYTDSDEYAFVECETKPRFTRILEKKTTSIVVQSRLLANTHKRLILAIPSGTLRMLNMKVRRF